MRIHNGLHLNALTILHVFFSLLHFDLALQLIETLLHLLLFLSNLVLHLLLREYLLLHLKWLLVAWISLGGRWLDAEIVTELLKSVISTTLIANVSEQHVQVVERLHEGILVSRTLVNRSIVLRLGNLQHLLDELLSVGY